MKIKNYLPFLFCFFLNLIIITNNANAETLDQDYIFLQQEINKARAQNISKPVNYVFGKYTQPFIDLDEKYQFITPSDDTADNDDKTPNLSSLKRPNNVPIKTWKNLIKFSHHSEEFPDIGEYNWATMYFSPLENDQYLLIDVPTTGTGAGNFTYVYDPDIKNGFTQIKDAEFILDQKGSDNELFTIHLHGKSYLVYRDEDSYALLDYNTLIKKAKGQKINFLKFKYHYHYHAIGLTKDHNDQVDHGNDHISQSEAQILLENINHFLDHDYNHHPISPKCAEVQIPTDNAWFSRTSSDLSFQQNNQCYYGRIVCYKTSDNQCLLNISTTNDGNNGIFTFDVQQKRSLINTFITLNQVGQ